MRRDVDDPTPTADHSAWLPAWREQLAASDEAWRRELWEREVRRRRRQLVAWCVLAALLIAALVISLALEAVQ